MACQKRGQLLSARGRCPTRAPQRPMADASDASESPLPPAAAADAEMADGAADGAGEGEGAGEGDEGQAGAPEAEGEDDGEDDEVRARSGCAGACVCGGRAARACVRCALRAARAAGARRLTACLARACCCLRGASPFAIARSGAARRASHRESWHLHRAGFGAAGGRQGGRTRGGRQLPCALVCPRGGATTRARGSRSALCWPSRAPSRRWMRVVAQRVTRVREGHWMF